MKLEKTTLKTLSAKQLNQIIKYKLKGYQLKKLLKSKVIIKVKKTEVKL